MVCSVYDGWSTQSHYGRPWPLSYGETPRWELLTACCLLCTTCGVRIWPCNWRPDLTSTKLVMTLAPTPTRHATKTANMQALSPKVTYSTPIPAKSAGFSSIFLRIKPIWREFLHYCRNLSFQTGTEVKFLHKRRNLLWQVGYRLINRACCANMYYSTIIGRVRVESR